MYIVQVGGADFQLEPPVAPEVCVGSGSQVGSSSDPVDANVFEPDASEDLITNGDIVSNVNPGIVPARPPQGPDDQTVQILWEPEGSPQKTASAARVHFGGQSAPFPSECAKVRERAHFGALSPAFPSSEQEGLNANVRKGPEITQGEHAQIAPGSEGVPSMGQEGHSSHRLAGFNLKRQYIIFGSLPLHDVQIQSTIALSQCARKGTHLRISAVSGRPARQKADRLYIIVMTSAFAMLMAIANHVGASHLKFGT